MDKSNKNGAKDEHSRDEKPSINKEHAQEGAASTIDTLQSIVSKDGILGEDVNIDKYAEIMTNETNPPQRILLLKIIVASLIQHPQLAQRLVASDLFLSIMYEWISKIDVEAAKTSLLVLKALEILDKLQLSIDQLVKYKFGRVVKKITQKFGESKDGANLYSDRIEALAKELFERWSSLATQNEPIPVPIPKKRSVDETPVLEIPEPPKPVPEQVEIQETITKEEFKSKKKRVRKVSFPEDEKQLVKVVLFERDPAEYEFLSDGSAAQQSYLHADRDEALKAFKLLKEEIEDDDLKTWYQPEALSAISEGPAGKDCEEKIIQSLRERTVLSVVYYSLHTIPPNPSESIVDEAEQPQEPKIIPSRDVNKASKRTIPLTSAPSLIVPPMLMNIPDPSILNSFLSNPSDLGSIFDRPTEAKPLDGPPSNLNYRPEPSVPRPSVCKYYRSQRPYSCKSGSSCRFLHQD